MEKRHAVQFGKNELTVLKELEKIHPDWKYKNDSEKFKEMFWKGVRNDLQTNNLNAPDQT